MFHVRIAHCMPEKIHKMSKCDNSCLFMWSTVVIGKSARGNFLSMVVMEMLKYTCVPSFTSNT